MRDTAFKRVLGSMPVGTEVKVLGPFGTFFVPDNTTRPVVCLAGGIGITPFRSMLLDAKKRGLSHMIYLFYSNRRPEDAAFLKEFTEQVSPQFVFVPTMTNAELSFIPWAGEIGYIDRVMLEKYLPKGSSPVYYLAGPEPMTHAMRTLLESMGVSNDDIRYEEFAGY